MVRDILQLRLQRQESNQLEIVVLRRVVQRGRTGVVFDVQRRAT